MDYSTQNDFNFLLGKWKILNRRLNERFANCNDWTEFNATLEVRQTLNGLAQFDEFKSDLNGESFAASTVRVFNPQTKLWSIYWMDSRSAELTFQVKGKFQNGLGEFYGEEMFNGKMVKLRFLWNGIAENSAHWEQAYFDETKNKWETNWTMDFSREN